MKRIKTGLMIAIPLVVGCFVILQVYGQNRQNMNEHQVNSVKPSPPSTETATLGGGCFWCLEAIYERLKGVEKVVSGFSGGTVANPSYEQVCTGTTGHAEVTQITFDPKIISYKTLLEVFFDIHDPTSLNRQGADIGTQYRSVIFYHSAAQEKTARMLIKEMTDAHTYRKPIVTQLVPFTAFYPAENYHQNYFNNNPNQPYCSLVIGPKVKKFEKKYSDILRK